MAASIRDDLDGEGAENLSDGLADSESAFDEGSAQNVEGVGESAEDVDEVDDVDDEEDVDEDYEPELEDDALDEFIGDGEDSDELTLADEELSPKEQNARSLAIRRAIEQRMDQKKLDEDLDYLDLDLDE